MSLVSKSIFILALAGFALSCDRKNDDHSLNGVVVRNTENLPSGRNSDKISENKKYKIALGIFYTENIKDYAKLAIENNRLYAEKHGYDLIVGNEVLVDKNEYTMHWNKYPFVANYIRDYDYFVWIDADAVIRDMNIKIEDWIEEGKQIVVSNDWGLTHAHNMNTGVIIFKGGDWSYDILNNMMTDSVCVPFHRVAFHDQTCLELMYEKNYNGARDKIKRISYVDFQGPFDHNFIYHQAGDKKGIESRFLAILKQNKELAKSQND